MKVTEYLDRFPIDLLSSSNGRKLVTRDDPMLFAIVYLIDHLKFEQNEPSLSEFHVALAEYGKSWITDDASKDCFIAPRSAGKTTWLFLILTLWAAAHEHLKFIAAFSDSASQATQHLQTFKHELDGNELLRKDYPELCKPMMGNNVKRHIAQSNEQIQQSNGFSFSAKGIDAKALGMKIGNRRPDLLLLDDIEPPEANYSALEVSKRLGTVLNSVFPLSIKARVAIIGTTTMSNSIIDQLRKVGEARLAWQLAHGPISDPKLAGSTADNTYYVNQTEGALSRFLVENSALSDRRAIEGAELAGEGAGDTCSIRIDSDGIQRESSEKADLGGVEAGSQSSFESIDWNIESISKSVKASQISDDGISLTPDRECDSSPMQKIDVKPDVLECATSTSLSCASNFDN